jgi:putative ABC transport system permease protein
MLSGFSNTLDEQLIDSMLGNIIIAPEENKYYIERADQVSDLIRHMPGVQGVSAQLRSTGYFEYDWKEKTRDTDKGKSGSWEVIGIDPQDESTVTVIHQRMIAGSYLSPGDRSEIILGVDVAGGPESHTSPFLTLGGAMVGEKVRVTYPNGVQREYRVKGIFSSQQANTDRTTFVSRSEIMSVLDRPVFVNRASQILIKTNQKGAEGAFIEQIKALGIRGTVRTWRDYGVATRSITESLWVVTSLIGGIGLAVAAIVMYIVIYINVANRRRQIGIMRAIGINRSTIIGSYMIQALFFAALGIIVGLALLNLGIVPYYASHPLDLAMGRVSLYVDSSTVIEAIIGLVVAVTLAGFLPALSITRQSIIKAIWG